MSLMADSCRSVSAGVAAGKNPGRVQGTVGELKMIQALVSAGSSYDETAVVQTWKAYWMRSTMA